MTILQLLEQKGFIKDVDFSFDGVILIALPKINESQEEYFEDIPSLESLSLELLQQEEDFSIIISEFLKGKDITEEDSLNIDLVLKGDLSGWRFANIELNYKAILDSVEQTKANQTLEQSKIQKISRGKSARETCETVLDLIAGFNLDRQLTIEQITQMQNVFTNAEKALRAGRPTFAKSYIQAITADGILVTQEMKDLCIELLANY